MTDPLDLIRLHMALECVGLDDHNQLVRIPGDNPDTVHRVYIARHDRGDSLFFRADVPAATCKKLAHLRAADFFEAPERVTAILEADAPVTEQHVGKSYVFPESVAVARYPGVVRLSQLDPALVQAYDPELTLAGREVFGILEDGQIVSTCESSRESAAAGEAWVRTLEAYRRRGYARLVTGAWAQDLMLRGKTPFYSHRWENLASQAVAQSLGLIQYIADAGYV